MTEHKMLSSRSGNLKNEKNLATTYQIIRNEVLYIAL